MTLPEVWTDKSVCPSDHGSPIRGTSGSPNACRRVICDEWRGAVFPLEQPDLRIAAAGGTAVRRTVLPSGLRILTEAVPGAQSATVGFWVPVGSRDETDGVFGSTHFLEHLLFKGTSTRTALDIAVAFDSVGGEHNAVTAKEYTCYYAKIRDVHLGMAVDVLSDMVAASLLDPDEFETERGVILEELASAEDDPGDVANERFFEAVLGDHPLGRPIGGNPTTIGDATRDAVAAHYRARYTPVRPGRGRGRRSRPRRPGRAGGARAQRGRMAARCRGSSACATSDDPRRARLQLADRRGQAADRADPSADRCTCARLDRSAADDDVRAQCGLRRRHVVASVPGGPGAPRARLLGVLVRRRILRRGSVRHVRGLLAQGGRIGGGAPRRSARCAGAGRHHPR